VGERLDQRGGESMKTGQKPFWRFPPILKSSGRLKTVGKNQKTAKARYEKLREQA